MTSLLLKSFIAPRSGARKERKKEKKRKNIIVLVGREESYLAELRFLDLSEPITAGKGPPEQPRRREAPACALGIRWLLPDRIGVAIVNHTRIDSVR